MKKILFSLLGVLCLFSATAQQTLPIDPAVRIGKLENGLTYYIRQNNYPENQIDFYIAQKVGSIQEEDNQSGLAHFLEHMCFNGTENFPGKELITYLEKNGVQFGSNLNAYTSVDETVYNISNVPSGREGLVDSCLLILKDWSNGLLLHPEEIDSERGVIQEEARTRDNSFMRMFERALPLMYQGEKYAYRLPIGSMEVIKNFKYQELRDYYEKWYRPDLQGVFVVGDIDVDVIENKIKNMFSDIPMPEEVAEREYLPVSDNEEMIVVIEKDKEHTMPSVTMYHKYDPFPAEMHNTTDYFAFIYMKQLVVSMLNDRLSEIVHKGNAPFLNASVSDESFLLSKTKKAFKYSAVCKEDSIDNALSAVVQEVERARRFGFTHSEYERAKSNFLSFFESAYKERHKTENTSYSYEYVNHFLNNDPIPGVEVENELMNNYLIHIPLEVVNSIIPSLISEKNRVLEVYCPEKEELAHLNRDSFVSIIEAASTADLTAYEDTASDIPLMSELPVPGKIVKTKKGKFDSEILTLSNGIKVIVKPTEYKADEISFEAFSSGGSSLYDDSEILQLNFLNEVVRLGGIGEFNTIELKKCLAGKNAGASTSINTYSQTINGFASPKDLETMLQLTYLSVTAPRKDVNAFENYKNRLKVSLEARAKLPAKALNDSVSVALYGHHPRNMSITADMIDQIDYDRILEMHKERFANTGNLTFVFVGNIDMETAKPLFEQYLGSLPSNKKKEKIVDRKMYLRKGEYRNVFSKEQETPKASVSIVMHGKTKYTPENRLTMSMLSQVLDMVYMEEIREKEGGTYGVSVRGSVSKLPVEQSVLRISFDTNPESHDKLSRIALAEFDKLIKEGPQEEHLVKIKEYMYKSYDERIKTNGYWLGTLVSYYETGVVMPQDYKGTVSKITPEMIRKFAESLKKANNLIEVTMTDDREVAAN